MVKTASYQVGQTIVGRGVRAVDETSLNCRKDVFEIAVGKISWGNHDDDFTVGADHRSATAARGRCVERSQHERA